MRELGVWNQDFSFACLQGMILSLKHLLNVLLFTELLEQSDCLQVRIQNMFAI